MVPFVGPSYRLSNRKASAQRSINLYLEQTEPGGSKPGFYLRPVDTLKVSGVELDAMPGRGVFGTVSDKFYAVAGNTVYSITGGVSARTSIGSLLSSSGRVSGAVGRTELVISDGTYGYVVDLSADTVTRITDVDFAGQGKVVYYGSRFVFKGADDTFIWSAIDDGATYDALDFATAESSPDGLVTLEVFRDELWLFGSQTAEVWRTSLSADTVYERNGNVALNIGCAAANSVAVIASAMFWVGQDGNGGPVVYMTQGYEAQRVSTHAIEEMLRDSSNIRAATGYTYQRLGHSFYCLDAPGLETTLVFDLTVGEWHERGELTDGGDWQPLPYSSHAYTGQVHVFCGSRLGTGYLKNFDDDGTPNAPCERISPHFSTPRQNRVFYSRFRLDCTMGDADDAWIQLSWSDDGGRTWAPDRLASLGGAGGYTKRVQWNRLGSSRDRIWRLRGPVDQTMDIVEVSIESNEGAS